MKDSRYLILVVEDDYKLARTLEDFLLANHFSVMLVMDGQAALDTYFANNHLIDLILLDGMLPKVDGYDVLKTIREYSDVPIIMLTARESEEEQLKGLETGADNYITKPFLLRVLKAHIDALLKRTGKPEGNTVEMGRLTLNLGARKAYLDGKLLNLTPKEFDLIHHFCKNENVVLSRESILDAVWGYDYEGDIRTVDTLVKQIRRKLTDSCPYIHSVYGVGYRFEVNDA